MKKTISILTVFAILMCPINISFVYAASADVEYNVIQINTGEYVAYNIVTRDLEVYVTDGYDPIAGAEVTITGLTATTNENGIAVIEDVPTCDEGSVLTVNSDIYGMRNNDILLLSSQKVENENQQIETTKFTVSY